ncbi:MAG: Thymidylate synthase [Candidatus Izimaplasma bacterium HR2]|nr:MAG: Thymidylate synthase [Candidatus Izimaplasma bacterium HR2]
MKLTQRSNDYMVAGHINKVQYVALMMMIAKAVGLQPGKFVHVVDNLHIYDRHVDAAKTILMRFLSLEKEIADGTIKDLTARLVFNPKSDNFYDFTIDDFEMIDYDPMCRLPKFEVAI